MVLKKKERQLKREILFDDGRSECEKTKEEERGEDERRTTHAEEMDDTRVLDWSCVVERRSFLKDVSFLR